jgi:hypothetical protein
MDSFKVELSREDKGKKKFQIVFMKEFIKGWNGEDSREVSEGILIF